MRGKKKKQEKLGAFYFIKNEDSYKHLFTHWILIASDKRKKSFSGNNMKEETPVNLCTARKEGALRDVPIYETSIRGRLFISREMFTPGTD